MEIEKAIEFYKAKSYEEGGIRDRYTRLVIEALEKQLSQKLTFSNKIFTTFYQCECMQIFWQKEYYNYCPHCGQRLDWEVEDEH